MRACAVISAFNEEAKIAEVVRGVLSFAQVVVVDDGSLDRTANAARLAGAEVICHTQNRGKGAAIKTGIAHFLKGPWDLVILMDGDGQHLASDVARALDYCASHDQDMLIGNRMGDVERMPWLRKWTNRFMSWLLSKALGVRVSDTQCGFRLIRRGLVEKLSLSAKRFDIESELLIQAVRLGAKIEEVPIQTVYGDEESKIRPLRDTVRFIRLLGRSFIKGRFRMGPP